MSRIRSIKPEWLDDELLATASGDARALSIALICLADDYGNGRCGRLWLAARAFPGRPPEVLDAALAELVKIRYAFLYEVEGQRYFSIRTWDKNQRVDKPGAAKAPRPNLATIEKDTERIAFAESQEFPANVQEKPAGIPVSRDPIPSSDLIPTKHDPDQTSKPGSARARGTRQLKPFLMHADWFPPPEEIAAQAQKFEARQERVRALLPEFRTYWARRGDLKTEVNWIRTFANQVARSAKNGDLYVVPLGARAQVNDPGAALTPEQQARVAQRQRDMAELERKRAEELLGGASG